MVPNLEVGRMYVLESPFSVERWCICAYVIPCGDPILIDKIPSPNRVIVLTANQGLHKARRSSLRLVVRAAQQPDVDRFAEGWAQKFRRDEWRVCFRGIEDVTHA